MQKRRSRVENKFDNSAGIPHVTGQADVHRIGPTLTTIEIEPVFTGTASGLP
jgi:hypothetical protein